MTSHSIINKISAFLNEEVIHSNSVGGGCIAQSSVINTQSGKKYFLKQGFSNNMFRCEANGLKEIRQSFSIKTPEVILIDDEFLLLEKIEEGHKIPDFYNKFGEQFASMHKYSNDNYGFYEDNYIGSTQQINTYSNSWDEFYFTHRLLYQFKLAEQNGYVTNEFKSKFLILESKVSDILNGNIEAPALLHGDLWGGNYMVDTQGEPVVIDPAVYYGHREADLAMTKLFGGFTKEFYVSYNMAYPLKDGYEYRENIYLLYHVMNHLNLFGSGYYNQVIQLLNAYS